MFKLRRVELLGFKSFADRTRLEFTDGIAGVVGPNGCGKSNLADAISWVLGEQSARMLRGERMADVIFNGTSTRPPTGMSEVSLTLVDPEYVEAPFLEGEPQNGEGERGPVTSSESEVTADSGGTNSHGASSPAARPKPLHRAGEITVTRRLFRSGESEYLINGEISRLRDIQDLFMGTGLGPESYAIIEQGRIGQILSSKPSDRRAIIEEAAGVSKFKTRKRLAEAKLESSRQNLARITDILEEVTKQVNSLKRQASKARRHRELQEELRGRLKVVLNSRLLSLDTDCRRLGEEHAKLQEDCAQALARLEELDQERKAAALGYEESESRVRETRSEISQRELDRQRLDASLEQAQQQISSLESRIEDARTESSELQGRLARLEREADELDLRASELDRQVAAAREAVARLAAEREDLSGRVTAGEIQVETSRQSLLAAVGRLADLRNQLVQAEEAELSLARQLARAEAEQGEAELEDRRLKQELEAVEREQSRGESACQRLARKVAESSAQLNRWREEESSRRSELDLIRQQLSHASARKAALEESLARHAYTTESVRRLLSGEIPGNGERFRPLGLLADFVEVAPGYEDVVEEFLKNDLDCVVVEQHVEARSGIALLKSHGAGRSTFFVTRVASNGHSQSRANSAVANAPGVLAHLRDLVQFEARLGLNGDLALPALENAYLVENMTAAERLAGDYPDHHFLTPQGEHYHHRLVSGGRGASAGPLAQRREFRELEGKIGNLEGGVRAQEKALEETGQRIAHLDKELERLTAEKVEAEKIALVANEKLRQIEEASQRAGDRLRILRSETAELERERKELEPRKKSLSDQLDRASAEETRWEKDIEAATESLRDRRATLDLMSEEHAEAQARSSALEERIRATQAEQGRLDSQREDAGMRQNRLIEQMAAWRQDQQRLAEECEAAEIRRSTLEAAEQAARAELSRLEQESALARGRREELSSLIETARTLLDSIREKRSATQVARARVESDRDFHTQRCRDELNADPAQLRAELTPEAALSGEALQAGEEEVRQIKARLEGLGAVNMTALEELEEAEERFRFLETQRQDLLASMEDTAQAIREIDEVSRKQFLEAFKSINSYFAESFRTLFGGGIGEMRLSDEADPESGIDIVAQPPGKRLQNVLLLSGGEKALAALSLLIAIFRYTPSPFCILDEVDAPLDESNVDRFTRMIQQMSCHTQFILITHNKRTMEIAGILYGVTMQEAGVSKMVSVEFEEVNAEPAAIPA